MPQAKNDKPFVMPGADPLDDGDQKPIDLSFMEETDEEKAEREAAEARKEELKAEAEAEEAEKQRLADEKKAAQEEADKAAAEAAAKKEDKKEELTDDEKAEAAKLEAERTAKDKGKKQPMVPKSRLDEVLAKNRELDAKLKAEQAAREAATPKPKENETAFDFDAKEAEYMQLVLDGEKEKALAIRREIRAAEKAEHEASARTVNGQDSEAVALAKAAEAILETFPQFAEGHEKYDAEATKTVIKMRDALIRGGSNAVEALNEAVEFTVKKYGFDEELAPAKDDKVVDLEERRKKDVKNKIDTQKKQPPEVPGEGERSRVKKEINKVEELTDEEFDALPEATRRRLRGDII